MLCLVLLFVPVCPRLLGNMAKRSIWKCVVDSSHCHLIDPAAEKVTSLGKDWHRFCLKCERCSKTLTAGSHAEVSKDW